MFDQEIFWPLEEVSNQSSRFSAKSRWSQKGEWTLGSEEFSAHREVLIAISSLIRAGRSEAALSILDHELGGGL